LNRGPFGADEPGAGSAQGRCDTRPVGRPAGRAPVDKARGQRGQGLIEYGVILVLMVVVCLVSLLFFGDQLSFLLSLIASAV
jgi:Flp pilus assembly pilin Flp